MTTDVSEAFPTKFRCGPWRGSMSYHHAFVVVRGESTEGILELRATQTIGQAVAVDVATVPMDIFAEALFASTITCQACNGDGVRRCNVCRSTGRRPCVCVDCDNEHDRLCDCDDGKEPCWQCEGAKTVPAGGVLHLTVGDAERGRYVASQVRAVLRCFRGDTVGVGFIARDDGWVLVLRDGETVGVIAPQIGRSDSDIMATIALLAPPGDGA